jgi:hypothetical protein
VSPPPAFSRPCSYSSSSGESTPCAAGPSRAHVATDDKAALARMAALASAPPAAGSSAHAHARVPEWSDAEDDADEDLPRHTPADEDDDNAPPDADGSVSLERSPFPPLPPKSRALGPPPDAYPSAPPPRDMDMVPSAPLAADPRNSGMLPSAPPLDDDDDDDAGPSAPPLDDDVDGLTLCASAPLPDPLPLYERS